MIQMGKDGWRETERFSGFFSYFYEPMNLLDMFNSIVVIGAAVIRIAIFASLDEPWNTRTHPRPDNRHFLIFGDDLRHLEATPSGLDEFTAPLKLVQIMYAFVVITLMFRYLESFTMVSFKFGILYLITLEMLNDVKSWLSFVFFFSIAVGVSFTVLMPAIACG